MNIIEQATVVDYHRSRMSEYEDAHRWVGWQQADGQSLRFQVLSEVADLTGASILDLGCGLGDLYEFLNRETSGLNYIGVELVPDFVRQANERFAGADNCWFYQGDFMMMDLPQVDYVMACGALSYRTDDPKLICKAIRKMYETCKKGMVFNFLNATTFESEGLLVSYDLEMIRSYCQTLSDHVVLRTDYHPEDATVYLYKG